MIRELNKIPVLAWWIAEFVLVVAVYCILQGQAIMFGSLPTWASTASIVSFASIIAVLLATKQYRFVYVPFLVVGTMCMAFGAADTLLPIVEPVPGRIALPSVAEIANTVAWMLFGLLALGAVFSLGACPVLMRNLRNSSLAETSGPT